MYICIYTRYLSLSLNSHLYVCMHVCMYSGPRRRTISGRVSQFHFKSEYTSFDRRMHGLKKEIFIIIYTL